MSFGGVMERFRDEANSCDSVTVCGRFEIFVNFLGERLKFRENFGCELGWSKFLRNFWESESFGVKQQGKTLQTLQNTPPPDIRHHRLDINNVLSHTLPQRLALIMSRKIDSPPPWALSGPYLNNVLGFTTTEGILI
jgi:hypothetical protein